MIVSEYNEKWIFCKHNQRDTYEIPGGHRELGETILQTAQRELVEETGACRFDIYPVCIYSVQEDEETFGMLYYAHISELGDLPDSEIERIELFDSLPDKLTYPQIQPYLFDRIISFISNAQSETA